MCCPDRVDGPYFVPELLLLLADRVDGPLFCTRVCVLLQCVLLLTRAGPNGDDGGILL